MYYVDSPNHSSDPDPRSAETFYNCVRSIFSILSIFKKRLLVCSFLAQLSHVPPMTTVQYCNTYAHHVHRWTGWDEPKQKFLVQPCQTGVFLIVLQFCVEPITSPGALRYSLALTIILS